MEITDWRGKEPATYERERGIAEVTVKQWHGAGTNSASEAIAHDEFNSGMQSAREGIEVGEVIGVVRIAHDDEPPSRRCDSTDEGGAVSPACPTATTRAPAAWASDCEPSVDPLSATTTSPEMPRLSRKACAFSTHVLPYGPHSRQGIRMVSSTSCSRGRSTTRKASA